MVVITALPRTTASLRPHSPSFSPEAFVRFPYSSLAFHTLSFAFHLSFLEAATVTSKRFPGSLHLGSCDSRLASPTLHTLSPPSLLVPLPVETPQPERCPVPRALPPSATACPSAFSSAAVFVTLTVSFPSVVSLPREPRI